MTIKQCRKNQVSMSVRRSHLRLLVMVPEIVPIDFCVRYSGWGWADTPKTFHNASRTFVVAQRQGRVGEGVLPMWPAVKFCCGAPTVCTLA